jgi:uncharacterized protein affecting Mg2+/Co2+ transport
MRPRILGSASLQWPDEPTRAFTCEVRVQYLPEQSQPPEGPFAFAYTVTIRNSGDVTAQLVAATG